MIVKIHSYKTKIIIQKFKMSYFVFARFYKELLFDLFWPFS